MIGVSPAFYISAYGKSFTAGQIIESIDRVADLGFGAMQLELFRPEAIDEWTPRVLKTVRERLDERGIMPTQFVAHFALGDFTSSSRLATPEYREGFARLVDLASRFAECGVITLPMPPFAVTSSDTASDIALAWSRMRDLIREYSEMAAAAGRILALEIMPGALINGTQGLRMLRSGAEAVDVRLNFDTGHAAACKENLASTVVCLGGAIAGTHLCDNYGYENLKLVPGDGGIDFPMLLRLMRDSGYRGSWDLEILCAPGFVEREYRRAAARLGEYLGEFPAAPSEDSGSQETIRETIRKAG